MSESDWQKPSAEQTQQDPQRAYSENEYPPGEWIDVCDMLQKKGKFGDNVYFTGRTKGCNTVRWVLKPFSKRELKFRRIPAQLHGKMFKLGYWQNLVGCANSNNRSNIRNP